MKYRADYVDQFLVRLQAESDFVIVMSVRLFACIRYTAAG
jgi:hypothetical protein